MKKLEAIQYRKTISAYGGSGSIIETMDNGSLLIKAYDEWPCFGDNERRNRKVLTNPRLLESINDSGYTAVQNLLEIPKMDIEARVQYGARFRDTYQTICADWFPRWFYCPKCRRMHKLDEWRQSWDNKFPKDRKFGVNYPACYNCSEQRGDKISRKRLEQIRFVMASLDSGKIEDIPFDKLFDVHRDENAWVIDGQANVRSNLSYHTGTSGDGLQSISIKSADGGYINLSSIYNHYIVKNGHAFRVVLRNATNTYFPNILSCLYIPQPQQDVIDKVKDDYQHSYSIDEISERYGISPAQVQDILNGVCDGDGTAIDLKMAEYHYITNPAIYGTTSRRREKDFYAIKYPNLKIPFVRCVYGLLQLKETSVLLSYSRISTRSKNWYDTNSRRVEQMSPNYVIPFKARKESIDFMPAIEGYGEGLFFELDSSKITNNGDRFVFMHTYCHLIMKELEFTCGYPVTSLKECLYMKDDKLGFLIYTIAGSEGSYGGLVSLLPNDPMGADSKLGKLVDVASRRAQDCPNDPICLNDENHPGHCFACVDLPETSCEEFNNDLDRNIFLKHMFPKSSASSDVILED